MKNNKLIITVLLAVFCHVPAIFAGNKILSIQSIDIAPYDEALRGFQGVCDAPIDKLVISKMQNEDIIKEIRKQSPSIILSIGLDALEKIKDINDIPIVYLMVPNPQSVSAKGMNITGIRMNIPQEEQLSIFLKAVPSIKSIGLLYNPERTGYIAQKAVDACKKAGINLIAKEIHDSREAPSAVKSLEGKIDGFWMLPDITVFTSETIEYLFLFSMENRVPIFTFSDIYLESGALISIGVNPFDMGSQAGEMALEILSGKSAADIQPVDARKEGISINLKVSGKLGIDIDETVFNGAKFLK